MGRSWLPSVRGLPRIFWYVWVAGLVNRLGGFVLPFLALYLTRERHLSAERVGLIIALYGVGAIASGLIGGVLADRIGRKSTMVLAMVLGAASVLHLGFAGSTAHIAVAALLAGLAGDLYRPAMAALVADVVPPADRTRAYGLSYWAINLGFALAAVIGGLVARHNFRALFVADAATSLAFAAIVAVAVPETRPKEAAGGAGAGGPARLGPFSDGVFLAFAAISFVVSMIFFQGMAALPIDMVAHGIAPEQYGWLVAINGVMIVLLQPFVSPLVEKMRRSHALALAAALTGIGFGATALATTPLAYAGTIALWTLGEIAMAGISPAVVSDLAPPSLRGSYQGVFQLSWGAATFAAPAIGALVLARFGAPALWGACAGAGLFAAGAHLAIAGPRRRRLEALRKAEGSVYSSGR